MRHLGSFALALVLAPAVFLLTGVGLDAFADAARKGPQDAPVDTALALAALAVAAAIYAVLVMARLSPVGPVLAGLALLAVSAWPMVDATGYTAALNDVMTLFSDRVEIRGFNLVGISGLGVFLAVPLLATVASPRRWSRYEFPVAEVEPVRYGSPQQPDATRVLSAPQVTEPVTGALPDTRAPSLGYPRATPVGVPTVQAPQQGWPAQPPLPPPPQPTVAPQPAVPQPPSAQQFAQPPIAQPVTPQVVAPQPPLAQPVASAVTVPVPPVAPQPSAPPVAAPAPTAPLASADPAPLVAPPVLGEETIISLIDDDQDRTHRL